MAKVYETEGRSEETAFAIWDCGSPLYDSYELVSLSHFIERHLMRLPSSLGGSNRFSRPSDVFVANRSDNCSRSNVRTCESDVSLLNGIGRFLGSMLWRRKRFGRRREKDNSLRTGSCCFCK